MRSYRCLGRDIEPLQDEQWVDIAQIEQEPGPKGEEDFYRLFAEVLSDWLDALSARAKSRDWGSNNLRIERTCLGFGFSEASKLNASVDPTESGVYNVVIETVSLLQLYDTYTRLLSNPTVLPDIGAVTHPYVPQALLKFQPTEDGSTTALPVGSTRSIERPDLDDAKREECRNELIRHAITFLFLHELGHVLGGHTDYRWARTMVGGIGPATQQMLEYLADMDAVVYALALTLATPVDDTYYMYPLPSIRLWGFATCILFHLIEAFAAEDSIAVSQYPPASRRSLIVNGTLRGVSPELKLKENGVLTTLDEAFDEGHRAWEAMGWVTSEYPTSGDWLGDWLAQSDKVKEQLEPFRVSQNSL